MFSKQHLSIFDWWLFFILMAIPVVNVVMFIIIILSKGVNKSLQNYVLAIVLPLFIFFIVMAFTGFGFSFLRNLV